MAAQRAKRGEKSDMMMLTCDKVETKRQQTAAKRKADEEGAQLRKKQKEEEKEAMLLEMQEASNLEEFDVVECEEEEVEVYKPSPATEKEEKEEAKKLVEELLRKRLGEHASLVVRYLGWQGPKRNTMPVLNTARASLRFI